MYSLILHGRRLVELQKWRHLRVSVQNAFTLSNSFSSASATDSVRLRFGRKGNNFTVSYLVGSLGLTRKIAESISRKVNFTDKANPDSVVSLFRSHGFIDTQISSIVTDYPELLMVDAERSLGPKLQFLQSRGASSSELTQIVTTVPKILGKRGDKTLSIYYDFVKEIIEADKSSKLCHSLPEGSKLDAKFRNILALRELGAPQKLLYSLLISDALFSGKERFEEALKKVVEMGFDPTTANFVGALRVIHGLSEKTIEEKVNVYYERLGLSVEDVWAMFKKYPMFLGLSDKNIANTIATFVSLGFTRDEVAVIVKRFPSCLNSSSESVKKKTEFVVKKMNLPLKALVLNPEILGYSMEKRIVPRFNIIKALMSKGLLGNELPLKPTVLRMTDQNFLNRYVRKHTDKDLVAELMSIFTRGHVS